MDTFIISILAVLAYLVYHIVSSAHSYWEKKGVRGPKPDAIFGNFKTVWWNNEETLSLLSNRLYKEYPNEKLVGIYLALTPALIVRDPEIMKTVLINDFQSFTDRGIRVGNDPISKNLFMADGDDWKILKQKIIPIYTASKLKAMVPLLNTCVDQFIDYLDTKIMNKKGPKEVQSLMTKYTMKTISSAAFGFDVDYFDDKPTTFENMTKKIFILTLRRRLAATLQNISPSLAHWLHLNLTPPDVVDFFRKLVREIVQEREGKPKTRKDFMDYLIKLKEEGSIARKDGVADLEITDELITAQAIVFYGAGLETTSGALSFLLYELAKNPAVQDRCCEEIDEVMQKCNGVLDYDSINDLKYTNMAFDEVLRMHTVTGFLARKCVKDYTISMNLTINKGTKLLIPVMALHKDPKYYPEPEKFDPDRFLTINKEYYMPFGAGPRNCIGQRFARIQSLLLIAQFLHKYRVSTCEKTAEKITYDPRIVNLAPKHGIWLNVERRH